MGVVKQMQLEQAEREHNERMEALRPEAEACGMEPEDYEAFLHALEKDD